MRYRKYQTVHENTISFYWNPFEKVIIRNKNLMHFSVPISIQVKNIKKPIHSTVYLSELVLFTNFV